MIKEFITRDGIIVPAVIKAGLNYSSPFSNFFYVSIEPVFSILL